MPPIKNESSNHFTHFCSSRFSIWPINRNGIPFTFDWNFLHFHAKQFEEFFHSLESAQWIWFASKNCCDYYYGRFWLLLLLAVLFPLRTRGAGMPWTASARHDGEITADYSGILPAYRLALFFFGVLRFSLSLSFEAIETFDHFKLYFDFPILIYCQRNKKTECLCWKLISWRLPLV